MSILKFSKLESPIMEKHNLGIIDIRDVKIFNQRIGITQPCSLNIFVTNICQNDCEFCINKDNAYCDIDNKEYLATLEKCLKELKGKKMEAVITGGEPTLNPYRLIKTMELCNKYNMPCKSVLTNGYNLLEEFKGKPLCQYMVDYGFTNNTQISRNCIDEDENNDIFKGHNISNQKIEEIVRFFKANNADVVISCNLVKGYVDNIDKILEFVSFYMDMGVNTIIFRELAGDKRILDSCKVSLKSILGDMETFDYIESLRGLFYNADLYNYERLLVTHYKSQKVDISNAVRQMSFINGVLIDGFNGLNYSKNLKMF